MKNLLTLSIGGQKIQAPPEIPQGGLEAGGAGARLVQISIDFLLIGSILLAFAFLIWGAMRWTSSGGDKAKIDSARKTITFSLLGLVLAFLSFFIIDVVLRVFGLPPLGQ